ncbi:MAG: response regulator, partial [Deltaproteobacteria bacterium]|nr:response regulator [Deltaproteobacteria bacterium]
MSTRTLLCVEPDEAALGVIVGTLEPYGFEIKNITNGEQVVEWAKKNRPALMLVSVEPRKAGYAICNKIKRSSELKEIPLILTSSDESPEKFEQHKTFKLHADDYMFKPLDRHELMRKVNVLVGLDEPDASGTPSLSSEIFVGTEVVSSEIAIEADDIVDESKLATPPPRPPQVPRTPAPGDPLGVNPMLDAMFDKEADAAFDALEISSPLPLGESVDMRKTLPGKSLLDMVTPPPVEPLAAGQTAEAPAVDSESDAWNEDEATRAMPSSVAAEQMRNMLDEEALVDLNAVPTVVPSSESPTAEVALTSAEVLPAEVEGNPDVLRQPEADEDALPLPDEVRATSVVAYATVAANDAVFSDLQKRVHELEDEKRDLGAVIDDLRSHLQAQPLHKEKDLLGLRETINRKEKDIL